MKLAMRCIATLALALFSGLYVEGENCSVSKTFEIKHQQALSGVLLDPMGAILPGIEIELLSGKRALQALRTDNQGRYDFGVLKTGKYRIRIRYAGDQFCAPKVRCETGECTVKSKVTLNEKTSIVIR